MVKRLFRYCRQAIGHGNLAKLGVIFECHFRHGPHFRTNGKSGQSTLWLGIVERSLGTVHQINVAPKIANVGIGITEQTVSIPAITINRKRTVAVGNGNACQPTRTSECLALDCVKARRQRNRRNSFAILESTIIYALKTFAKGERSHARVSGKCILAYRFHTRRNLNSLKQVAMAKRLFWYCRQAIGYGNLAKLGVIFECHFRHGPHFRTNGKSGQSTLRLGIVKRSLGIVHQINVATKIANVGVGITEQTVSIPAITVNRERTVAVGNGNACQPSGTSECLALDCVKARRQRNRRNSLAILESTIIYALKSFVKD